jgi:E3 ubiquitin-protein ligase HACE1
MGAASSLGAADNSGKTPAHVAALKGKEGCLRLLFELGAGKSLSAADNDGKTPAHAAALRGNDGCLRVLHEKGASASLAAADKQGMTPAHLAAAKGNDVCLRVLHSLGAGASLAAAGHDSVTPAHRAAENGHLGCLCVLHEALSTTIESQLAVCQAQLFHALVTSSSNVVQELYARRALAWNSSKPPFTGNVGRSPIGLAAREGHVECVRFLLKIGGGCAFFQELKAQPSLIDSTYPTLIAAPGLLDLPVKEAWLAMRLERAVGDADAGALDLVSHRGSVLYGLCAQLGVDEGTAKLVGAFARARPLHVRFMQEASSGDGLRREWFGDAIAELIDPARGLFVGNRTLHPNPHSGTTAGTNRPCLFKGCVSSVACHLQRIVCCIASVASYM